MFENTDHPRLDEAQTAVLDRLRWKMYLFTVLLVGSCVSILALAFGAEPEFVYRATLFGLVIAAMIGVGIPYGEIMPSAPYALLGLICVIVVRRLSDIFPGQLALGVMAGAAMLVMAAVLAWFVIRELELSRLSAIIGCLALAGAAAALAGFGSLFFSVPLAVLMAVGVICHVLEIRRLNKSV